MCVRVRMCTFVRVDTHLRTCACARVYVRVRVRVCMCVRCSRACVRVRTNARACVRVLSSLPRCARSFSVSAHASAARRLLRHLRRPLAPDIMAESEESEEQYWSSEFAADYDDDGSPKSTGSAGADDDHGSPPKSKGSAGADYGDDDASPTKLPAFGGGVDVSVVDCISDRMCCFEHTAAMKVRALWGRNVVHHEVTRSPPNVSPQLDVKLMLETFAGYEIAAKKMVRFLIMSHGLDGQQRLTSAVPPPPKGWKPRDEPSAIGDDGRPLSQADKEKQRKLQEINALFLKHEGEQRLWAYPMYWKRIDRALDETYEAEIAARFVQLRREPGPWTPSLQRVIGDGQHGIEVMSRVQDRATSLLTTLAFGNRAGQDHAQRTHLQGRALTLSLPEVFRAYWDRFSALQVVHAVAHRNSHRAE